MSTLKSYLDESFFLGELVKSFESNKSEKDTNDSNLANEYRCTQHNYEGKDFNYMEEIDFFGGTKIKNFVGRFSDYEEKKYSNNMIFTMIDNGVFHTKVQIKTDDEIEITTKVDIVRSVDGINYDGKSVKDNTIFKDFPHENFEGSMEMKEYYKVIANRTRLLHYSDDSDIFEVCNLTAGWKAKDGIENLVDSKVFKKSDYTDLEEIMSIVSSTQEKHLVKKNDSTN